MSQQPKKARLDDLQPLDDLRPDGMQDLTPEEADAVLGGDGSSTTTTSTKTGPNPGTLSFTHLYDKSSPI